MTHLWGRIKFSLLSVYLVSLSFNRLSEQSRALYLYIYSESNSKMESMVILHCIYLENNQEWDVCLKSKVVSFKTEIRSQSDALVQVSNFRITLPSSADKTFSQSVEASEYINLNGIVIIKDFIQGFFHKREKNLFHNHDLSIYTDTR